MNRAKLLQSLSVGDLEIACLKAQGVTTKRYGVERRISASDAVQEILRRVGPAGEQAQADEQRYFDVFTREQYSSRNHKGTDWRDVSLVAVARDGSAALLCFADVGSFLHVGSGDGGLHHLRFSAYLVVRDATSGNRHVLRIPPRFGMYKSATYKAAHRDDPCGWCGQRKAYGTPRACKKCPLPAGPEKLIHDAAAWTFSLAPHDYAPQIAA